MADKNAPQKRPALSLTRNYNAPPEKVWRAWTEPQALKHWFSPEEADRVVLAQTDVREQGWSDAFAKLERLLA